MTTRKWNTERCSSQTLLFLPWALRAKQGGGVCVPAIINKLLYTP